MRDWKGVVTVVGDVVAVTIIQAQLAALCQRVDVRHFTDEVCLVVVTLNTFRGADDRGVPATHLQPRTS